MGDCSILSAKARPVGFGWSQSAIQELIGQGYSVSFTERGLRNVIQRYYGLLYASFFKLLKFERAFGHSNPYHRYAFDPEWLYDNTMGKDLCEIHYSYWARFRTACPKVVIVHDLWSDIMWEGPTQETKELAEADLLVTVSYDDLKKLVARGLKNVHWSPPCVAEKQFPDTSDVCVVGSANRHNIEGLQWLRKGLNNGVGGSVKCYGEIGKIVQTDQRFLSLGRYKDLYDPYEKCGIVLMLTTGGTGVQIKGVEALASGRAVVARKGAMRGLPTDPAGWIEVDTVVDMCRVLKELQNDTIARRAAMERARTYYRKHLHRDLIMNSIKQKYEKLRCI